MGQALALYVDGDRILFDRCRMLASQDTIFTGPLPPKEIEPNGFIGPKQYAPRINGRHYYKDCFIRGDIDFIFGSATAYFENCELYSQDIGREINGYVTAASTPEGQEYGYVFEGCHFTGNCPPRSVYLGRPWRNLQKLCCCTAAWRSISAEKDGMTGANGRRMTLCISPRQEARALELCLRSVRNG